MTMVDNFEMVSYKNCVYTLVNDDVTVEIDMELNTLWVTKNGRTYKTARFTKKYEYLVDLVKELEEAQEAEEAIERESCDLQDVVVNIDSSSIGRVVGMNNGKYRIVMSTGKLVELNRNEFYLDGEESINKEEKENNTVKIGHYNYELFENEFVIRFTCKSLDRVFIYNKKYKDFKLMQLSTNRVLLAKRYYTNFYVIISQLQNYILGAKAPSR